MARVPTYDQFQAAAAVPSTQQFGGVTSSTFTDFAAQQSQQRGQAQQQSGELASKVALDMQAEANQLRVIEASNQAKEASFDLLYHPETGALNQRGRNALQRESGESLPAEVSKRFNEITSQISAGLGNDMQRAMFRQQATSMHAQIYGQTQQHLASEFKSYRVSEMDATANTGTREIALIGASGNIPINPETGRSQLDEASDRVIAAIKQKARLVGLSQEEADNQAMHVLSGAHSLAIKAAIDRNDIAFASRYLKERRGQMEAKDIVAATDLIGDQQTAKNAIDAVTVTTKEYLPAFQGDDKAARAFHVAVGAESGYRQFDKSGAPLTSKAGAVGIAQVMPATGPEAAKLAGLPWDEHRYRTDPAYNYTIGKAYFNEQLRVFGNVEQAWAAYNAGAGRVKEAIAKSEKSAVLAKNDPTISPVSWLAFVPKETRDYVLKNSKALEGGGGRTATPSELEFVQSAVQRLGPNATSKQITTTQAQAERQYALIAKEKKQREDEGFIAAQEALVANGGNMAALPASVRAAVPAARQDDLLAFAGKIAKGVPIETDWDVYYQLRSLAMNPDTQRSFAGEDLRLYYGKLAPQQREQLIDLQAKVSDPARRPEVMALSQQLSMAHNQLKFGSTDAVKKGLFDNAVSQDIAVEMREKKRELTFEERDRIIKRNMLPTSDSWWPKRRYEVAGTAMESKTKVVVTPDDRDLIVASLKEEGLPVSEQAIVERFKRKHGLK